MNTNFNTQATRRSLRSSLPFLFLALLFLGGCRPRFDSMTPASGPPGTLVRVNGQTFLANVKWDAGTASETQLPPSFLGAAFFTVPLNASVGSHSVSLYGSGQYSANTLPFQVVSGTVRPAPRIDDISCNFFSVNGRVASFLLMVHGANFDVGGKIVINGVEQTTYFWRGLGNQANLQAADPSTLGYPIFHYGTLVCMVKDIALGSTLTSISVKNTDGTTSVNMSNYVVATSLETLDSDGDGLSDSWEKNGADVDGNGTVDVNLPALGANPLRKDIFIEVDWMNGVAPNAAIWSTVINTFSQAPVLNSDGSNGIAAHIDYGQAGAGGGGGTVLTFSDAIRYDNASPYPSGSTQTSANFYTLKSANFNSNRLRIYRYCIFANDNGHQLGSSGRAENIWCNDFFVSIGAWGTDGTRTTFQVGTFLHELGHTLSLRHGGFEDTNSKDNYNSVMQYGNQWVVIGGQNEKPSPSQFGGVDVDCNIDDVDNVFSYSQGMRRDLNESCLNEANGICDHIARDFNGNGNTTDACASVNLDTNASLSTIRDFADWANLKITFTSAGSQWAGN